MHSGGGGEMPTMADCTARKASRTQPPGIPDEPSDLPFLEPVRASLCRYEVFIQVNSRINFQGMIPSNLNCCLPAHWAKSDYGSQDNSDDADKKKESAHR